MATPRFSLIRVQRPTGPLDDAPWRNIDQNFEALKAALERAITAGTLLSLPQRQLVGDVIGYIGDDQTTTVEKIRNVTIPAPAAGDDGKAVTYNHGGVAFTYTDKLTDVFTTRGDLLYRGASAESRLAVGAANTLLKSDGTDPGWGTLTALIDAAIGSTRGGILYRGASGWALLSPNTSGFYLKDGGAGADPSWAAIASTFIGLTDTPAAYTGAGGQFVKVNAGESALEFVAGSTAAHDLLSATHSDTTAAAVTRGGLIVGKTATPKWELLTIGASGKYLYSDGTDVSWADPPAAATHDLLSATHGDTLAGAVASGDIIYGNNTPKWARLAKGSDGQVLTLASGLPSWATASVGAHALLSATHSDTLADTVVRGDILYGNSTPAWARLAKGTRRWWLGTDGTDVAYQDPRRFAVTRNHNVHMFRSRSYNQDGGFGRAMSTSGTAATSADAERASTKVTDATTGDIGWRMAAGTLEIQSQHYPYARFDAKLVDGVDGCLWMGLYAAATFPNTAALAAEGAAFRWRNGTDTNIQCVTRDSGGTQDTQDSGVAMDGNWHDYEILTDDGGTTWKFYIDGALVQTMSTNVPTSTTSMAYLVYLPDISSSARELRFSYASLVVNPAGTI